MILFVCLVLPKRLITSVCLFLEQTARRDEQILFGEPHFNMRIFLIGCSFFSYLQSASTESVALLNNINHTLVAVVVYIGGDIHGITVCFSSFSNYHTNR